MNTNLVWATFTPVVVIGTGIVLFLRYALPLRQQRPDLLQNGLWFLLPILLTPFTFIYSLVLAPIVVLGALLSLVFFSRKIKAILRSLAAGELVSCVGAIAWLEFLNTYMIRSH